jgi:hypothetical protein
MPYVHHERGIEGRRFPPSTLEWRTGRLVDAGFTRGLALRLARDTRYDLHALIELVERGCPPSLAVRILAPLDEPPPAV